MDNQVSANIDIIDNAGTYIITFFTGFNGASPTYKFQDRETIIHVLSQMGITESEINDAITNRTCIQRERLDQRKLEIVLAPYAVRERE